MIPFNRQVLMGNELEYIQDAYSQGKVSGDGKYTKLCSEFMERTFSAKKVLLTPSCTHALELAALLIDIQPGDEVIMPSYTFVSTANAFVLRGARPVFCDIRPDTLNIDEEKIEALITERTKAIVPVHYGGVACDMDRIIEIAKAHDLYVIEDAAQAVNARYKGRYLGTIGHFGCYSFHETKNYSMGEGGAIVINDERFIERAEIIREKGTNRSKFFRGEIDKYSWVDIGSSYLPSDISAAVLWAQLEKLDEIQEKRLSIWNAYYAALKPYEEAKTIRLPIVPDYAEHNAHLFYVLFTDEQTRDKAMEDLKKQGIHAVFHYIPLHSAPMGQRYGYSEGDLPVTEDLSGRLLRLPMYAGMRDDELQFTVSRVGDLLKNPSDNPNKSLTRDHHRGRISKGLRD
ncbi:MAG: TDP-4-keto-6-deoxy-D-glucose transaminase [Methanomicrobiales archaeon 53_19]|nr:MAG: TDP-4-keto-6-deoxy-D-glucose transaminase [Methanomicrobiales archaeon 53_19]HIJ05682.1 dTDP-4-amino-4,6-dideoxygalactose transaminase [Methanocalculus sp.]